MVGFVSLVGCATTEIKQEKPIVDDLPTQMPTNSRNPEVKKSYAFNTYVDPQRPDTRYPEGKLERIEEDASWNLRKTSGPAVGGTDPNHDPTIQTAEISQDVETYKRAFLAQQAQNERASNELQRLNENLIKTQETLEATQENQKKILELQKEVEQLRLKDKNAENKQKTTWQKAIESLRSGSKDSK